MLTTRKTAVAEFFNSVDPKKTFEGIDQEAVLEASCESSVTVMRGAEWPKPLKHRSTTGGILLNINSAMIPRRRRWVGGPASEHKTPPEFPGGARPWLTAGLCLAPLLGYWRIGRGMGGALSSWAEVPD
jgi:hypothetical protein